MSKYIITKQSEPKKDCTNCGGTGNFRHPYDDRNINLDDTCSCIETKSITLTEDEAVERMAKAMSAAYGSNQWERYSEQTRNMWRGKATAALQALTEEPSHDSN